MKSSRKYNIIAIFILTGIALFAVQGLTNLFPERNLAGHFKTHEMPEPAMSSILDGTFQKKFNTALEDHIGFHKMLVRVHNTMDYKLYGKIHVKNVVEGRKGYLFDTKYLDSYLGNDFIGYEKSDTILRSMLFIQDYLEKHGTSVLYVIAPGKGEYYHEYLPEKINSSAGPSNHDVFSSRALDLDLNMLDVHQWFLNAKDTTKERLYPKYGIHWSLYSLPFVIDSINSIAINSFNLNVPEYRFSYPASKLQCENGDFDIIRSMNLIVPPQDEKIIIPKIDFIEAIPEEERASLLTIGDSFFKTIYKDRVLQKLYRNNGFYYYCRNFFPKNPFSQDKSKKVKPKVLLDECLNSDILLVIGTESNLYQYPFRLHLYLIEAIFDQSSEDEIYTYYDNLIEKDPTWRDEIIIAAEANNISYEEAKRNKIASYLETGYLDKAINARKAGVEEIKEKIRNSKSWTEKMKKKAERENISFDDAVQFEAEYVYDVNH